MPPMVVIVSLLGSAFCIAMSHGFLSDWASAGEAMEAGEATDEQVDEATSALVHAFLAAVFGLGLFAVALEALQA